MNKLLIMDIFVNNYYNYLNVYEYKIFGSLSKCFILKHRKYLCDFLHNLIVKTAIGFDADLPKLNLCKNIPWKNRYLGFTGYIDRLQVDDFFESGPEPVGLGVDLYNRIFIAIYLKTTNKIIVIFERYPNAIGVWVWGAYDICETGLTNSNQMADNWDNLKVILSKIK